MSESNDGSPAPLFITEFDPETDARVSMVVVRAVAAVRDQDPTDLPPLQRTVDTEALDAAITSGVGSETRVAVAFDYGGYRVHVTAPGTVALYERAESHAT